MKIEKGILDALNAQIHREYYSAYLYLSMSHYCYENGLPGFGNWLNLQKMEDCVHAEMLAKHILERSGRVQLATIEAPPRQWENVQELFEAVLEHERLMTMSIQDLATLASAQKDFAVQSLLKRFIDAQVEEESMVENILHQMRYAQIDTPSIFLLDRELAQRTQFDMKG